MSRTAIEVAEEILRFLKMNGKPHSIREVVEHLRIPVEVMPIVDTIIQFLAMYQFIQYDKSRMEITIKPDIMEIVN